MPTYELLMNKLKAGVQHSVRDFFFPNKNTCWKGTHVGMFGWWRPLTGHLLGSTLQAMTTAGPRWIPIHRGEMETHSRPNPRRRKGNPYHPGRKV